MSAQVQCQVVESNVEKWVDFNQKLQSQTEGKIPSPFAPVETLAFSKFLILSKYNKGSFSFVNDI